MWSTFFCSAPPRTTCLSLAAAPASAVASPYERELELCMLHPWASFLAGGRGSVCRTPLRLPSPSLENVTDTALRLVGFMLVEEGGLQEGCGPSLASMAEPSVCLGCF